MKRTLAVLALAIALPVFGQDDEVFQRRRAAIAELLTLIDIKAVVETALRGPAIAPKERELRDRLARELDTAKLIELYTPLFEEEFTEPELQETLAFLKTAAGTKSLQMFRSLYTPQLAEIVLSGKLANAVGKQLEQQRDDPAMITMQHLRALASATEAYATDYNVYPRGDFNALRPLLEPVYLKAVPLTDGWGNPFLYVSDGTRYRFVSAGADGHFEYGSRSLSHDGVTAVEQTSNPEADIIFEDGSFVRAPRHAVEQQEY
jgi:hypothetical protein